MTRHIRRQALKDKAALDELRIAELEYLLNKAYATIETLMAENAKLRGESQRTESGLYVPRAQT